VGLRRQSLSAYTREPLHAITFRCHLPACANIGLRQGVGELVKWLQGFLTNPVCGVFAANRYSLRKLLFL
jgi:hypothetical protein